MRGVPLAAPRGLRLPNRGIKIKGMQIAPHSDHLAIAGESWQAWCAMWGSSAFGGNFEWEGLLKPQVDQALLWGANLIKTCFPMGDFHAGGQRQATAETNVRQFLDYVGSKGLLAYMTMSGRDYGGGTTWEQIGPSIAEQLTICNDYDFIVACDMTNSVTLGSTDAQVRTRLRNLMPYGRNATDIPLTFSIENDTHPNDAHGHPQLMEPGTIYEVTHIRSAIDLDDTDESNVVDRVDFIDTHGYLPGAEVLEEAIHDYRDSANYRGHILIGEVGGIWNAQGSTFVANRWNSLDSFSALPDCLGVVGFCILDYDNPPPGYEMQWGIFDKNFQNERTTLSAGFATWPAHPTPPGLPAQVPNRIFRTPVATPGVSDASLVWGKPGGSVVTGYKVYRKVGAGAYALHATLGNVLNFLDEGLTEGVTYGYRISAINGAGEGPQSAEAFAAIAAPSDPHSVRLEGLAGEYLSTPITAAVQITGPDLTLMARAKTDVNPIAAQGNLIGIWGTTANQQGYMLYVGVDGKLKAISANGAGGFAAASSTVLVDLTTRMWVAAWIELAQPSGDDWRITFHTAPDQDGIPALGDWVQLGDPVTGLSGGAAIAAITAVNNNLRIGSAAGNTNMYKGNVYHAVVIAGGLDGEIRAEPDISDVAVDSATFLGTTGELWTVNGGANIVA